jgi:[acyl-carrier-protein] S-malonyltransferase
MAGHSLGEYSAYVAAGSITFEEGLNLVMLRAKYMQEAVQEGDGGIAAILGLTKEELDPICKAITANGDLVSMANLNSDKQIVISGTRAGVENAIVLSKENGAKRAIPLAMSVPSHCELMKPASVRFSEELKKINFKAPKTKVLQNFSVTHSDNVDVIKNNLVSQLYSPVRWDETMNEFQDKNLESLYECGPSKVLTGLVKRKFMNTKVCSLDDYETLEIIQGA